MGPISVIAHWPAWWGVLGAFVYAANRLVPCLAAARAAKQWPWGCVADFFISLAVGGIGAAAFTTVAEGFVHLKDPNAVATLIGLLANPIVPKITGSAPALLGLVLESPLARALKGETK